ncbi:MAG: MFS transporter [Lachnospiraceae bacterium]|nr:MFS transporter [Lachnospiraceae bacterium]
MNTSTQKLWTKDFFLVVIGQIISLFGNGILRFVLPLYLLDKTGSAFLYGLVSACSFIPLILLSPVGGIVADRVNKRNIIVALDFSTAAIMAFYMITYKTLPLIPLMILILILLYGISGAYQPAVQASIPVLASTENLIPANSMINLVSSLSGLLGPALGGICYSLWGLNSVLAISILCFLISAVMEIFIPIPFSKIPSGEGILKTVQTDFKESLLFIRKDNPAIGSFMILLALFNMVLSALLIIGLPVIVTQIMSFSDIMSKQLTGYMQAVMALGGLAGGILCGLLGRFFSINKCHRLLMGASLLLLPIALAFALRLPDMLSYIIIALCCFLIMVLSTLFSVVAMSYIQQSTPSHLIGKIIATCMAFATCAQPVGQVIYGFLFEHFSGSVWIVFLAAALVSLLIATKSSKMMRTL